MNRCDVWIEDKWQPKTINRTQIAICCSLTGRLAQLVERRTREHNVSGLYRWVRVPGWPTKIINCLSDETLNRGPV